MARYTTEDLMTCVAARELKDGEVVFIGTGLPLRAAFLAQRTHAPNLVIVNEMGVAGPKLSRMPSGVSDPVFVTNALFVSDMLDALGVLLPYVDVAFIGGAQIDKYGNVNSTVIGDYYSPKVRLVGSGGANDIASIAKRVIIVTRHEKRRLVEKVDYVTSVGHVVNGRRREELGLPGGGPHAVISDLAVMYFDPQTKEMYVAYLHPGVTVEQVKENTGFDIKVAPDVKTTPPPSDEELKVLEEIKAFFGASSLE